MTPDLDHARRLLAMARKDLKALSGMMDAEIFDDEIFGFHAQQAVEKSLKAWLEILGVTTRRTHDLGWLLSQLSLKNVEIRPFLDLLRFNLFAVQFRYEAMAPLEEPVNRSDTVSRVTELLGQVQELFDRMEGTEDVGSTP